MHQHKAKAYCQTSIVASTDFRIRGSKNDEHENEGCDDLYEECATSATGISHAIGTKTGRSTHRARSTRDADDEQQNSSSNDAANELANPIAESVFPAHTT